MKVRVQLDFMCSSCKKTGRIIEQAHDLANDRKYYFSGSLEHYLPDNWATIWKQYETPSYKKIFCEGCKEKEIENLAKLHYNQWIEDGGAHIEFDKQEWIDVLSVNHLDRGVTLILE